VMANLAKFPLGTSKLPPPNNPRLRHGAFGGGNLELPRGNFETKFPWDRLSAENFTLCSIYSPWWHLWCAKKNAAAPLMCLRWWQIPLGSASGICHHPR
jgi:hypothetical protein